MLEKIIEQSNILLIAIVGVVIYLIQFYKDKMKFKRELREKIEQVETEIALTELKKSAEREEAVKDKFLQYRLNRNVLLDGVKINHILKELREELNAQSVSIAIYHNGIAKGFKNFSFRFQETRSVIYSTIYKYQIMPLSPYYEELTKYEEKDFVCYIRNDKNNPGIITSIMDRYDLSKLASFPILVEYSEDNSPSHGVLSILREGVKYMLIGSLVISLDKSSVLHEDIDCIDIISEKLDAIMLIYKENNNIFS